MITDLDHSSRRRFSRSADSSAVPTRYSRWLARSGAMYDVCLVDDGDEEIGIQVQMQCLSDSELESKLQRMIHATVPRRRV